MSNNKAARFCATVLYPFEKGVAFDFDKYSKVLIPRWVELLGTNCVKYEIWRGLNSPGEDHPQFVVVAHFWLESAEAFGAVPRDPRFGPLMQEIAQVTTIRPVRQFCEVAVAE